MPQVRASDDVALVGVCAIAVVLPFERLAPVLTLPWQRVSTVECVAGATFLLWVAALIWLREAPRVWTPMLAPWIAVLAAGVVAAWTAPSHRVDALKTMARLASGLLVYLLAINAAINDRRLAGLMASLAAAGVVVAALAIAEFRGVPTVLAWLNEYRDGVRVVGGQVRAGGTLQYPTIAAMYLEIVFACAAALCLAAWDQGARPLVIAAIVVALVVVAEGVALTFTRAGLAGLIASLGALAWDRARRRGLDGGVRLLGALAAVVVLLPVWSWSTEAVRLRFSSEGRQGWYRAEFAVAPALTVAAGAEFRVPVSVRNSGRLSWSLAADQPFRVSYHWLDGDSDRIVQYDGARAELPFDVAPGASADVEAMVRAPERPGRYRLRWDVVQEHRLWFGTEPGATHTDTTVAVTPAVGPVRPLPPGKGPRVVPPPDVVLGRRALWTAAARLVAAHPWLGVGPDNFRHLYGAVTGMAHADPRVHSNNMYLEVLTGAGLVGASAFGWLLWRAGRVMLSLGRRLPPPAVTVYAGAGAAAIAVLVHGVLDSFLTFTPTGLAMALILGLAAAPARWTGAVEG